jgi:hypothetical protein
MMKLFEGKEVFRRQMERDPRRGHQLASELGNFNLNRAYVNLAIAQENADARRFEISSVMNDVLGIELTHELESATAQYENQYREEVRKYRTRTRSAIRDLELEAEEKRKDLLMELERANLRIRIANESIAASQEVLKRPIPTLDDNDSSAVYQKGIEAARSAIENLKSKRPAWEKIRNELSEIQTQMQRRSPRRSQLNPPQFYVTPREIAQGKK